MKERPILFSGPMVRSIIDGSKTQTRRVLKFPHFHGCMTGDCPHEKQAQCDASLKEFALAQCPYGVPGDRLWVRETWGIGWQAGMLIDPCINYRAGDQLPLLRDPRLGWRHAYSQSAGVSDDDLLKIKDGWRPSIFMPRWASRILLEIADVRVDRVQDISETDAKAEGAKKLCSHCGNSDAHEAHWVCEKDYDPEVSRRVGFHRLWDSINAKRGFGWEVNPWDWAITFKKLEAK